MKRVLGTLILAPVMALALVPAQSDAFYAGVEDGVVKFSADPGDGQQIVGLGRTAEGIRLGAGPRTGGFGGRPRYGDGCREDNQQGPVFAAGIVCDASGVRAVEVALGEGDDILSLADVGVPVTYSGGEGQDQGRYTAPGGVFMDTDGVADDGPARRDNVLRDVEMLWGTPYRDTLGAGPAGAHLTLGEGADTAIGGRADDVIHAVSVSSGFDQRGPLFTLHPDGRDRIRCGTGRDAVVADRRDTVGRDCEVVGRDGATWRRRPAYVFRGSTRADRIVLETILPPGGWMRTKVDAGRGNDRIDTRDGHSSQRPGDVIHCGPGRDTVYADRRDRTFSDCERVRR